MSDIVNGFYCEQVEFLSMHMLKAVQAKRSEETPETLGKIWRHAQQIITFAVIDLILNKNWPCQTNINLVLTNINWVKSTQPTEPKFSTSTLLILMGGHAGNIWQSRLVFL